MGVRKRRRRQRELGRCSSVPVVKGVRFIVFFSQLFRGGAPAKYRQLESRYKNDGEEKDDVQACEHDHAPNARWLG